MAVTSIVLADPVSGYSVQIMGAPGVAVTSLEVEPAVRAVTESQVASHGSFDTTRFLDSAVVTMQLLLYGTSGSPPYGTAYTVTYAGGSGQAAFLDSLAPLLAPSARPRLIVGDDDWAIPRQLTVRLDSMSKARSDPTNWPVQLLWTAPNGVWEDAVQQNPVIVAIATTFTGLDVGVAGIDISSQGLHMPPGGLPSGTETIVTNGSAVASWTALLYGPCSGPKIANDTTGETLNFAEGFSVSAGSFVAVDSRAHTALMNGDPAQTVSGSVNWPVSAWWQLQPGQNLIRYYPTSGGSSTVAQLSFRPAWMP